MSDPKPLQPDIHYRYWYTYRCADIMRVKGDVDPKDFFEYDQNNSGDIIGVRVLLTADELRKVYLFISDEDIERILYYDLSEKTKFKVNENSKSEGGSTVDSGAP